MLVRVDLAKICFELRATFWNGHHHDAVWFGKKLWEKHSCPKERAASRLIRDGDNQI
jgi:hypothetical protein